MKAKTLVIHLARATARRPQVEKLLRELPFAGSVVDAVDGLALSGGEIEACYRPALHRPRYPFGMRKEEIGCFLSHRKAWQAIVDGELDAGLIVEDDVEVDVDKLRRVLDVALQFWTPGDYLRFPQKVGREPGRPLAAGGDVVVSEPKLPGLGMVMQLVGREAAQALLHTTQAFDRPVDTLIQMRWLHPIRILTSQPVCVREISRAMGGTTIQKKEKSAGEVLQREVRRSLYRLAVRLENARRLARPAPTA